MPKLTKKQLLIFCVMLLLVDVVLIQLYVDYIEPYENMSVGVGIYRFKVCVISAIIACIVVLFKRRYSFIFLANIFMCAFLITFLWNNYIETHPFSSTKYYFEYKNKKYKLDIENNPDYYSISYPKDSIRFADLESEEEIDVIMRNTVYSSIHEKEGDSLLLYKDFDFETRLSSYMYFYKDTLIGFAEKEIKIKVTEIINE